MTVSAMRFLVAAWIQAALVARMTRKRDRASAQPRQNTFNLELCRAEEQPHARTLGLTRVAARLRRLFS